MQGSYHFHLICIILLTEISIELPPAPVDVQTTCDLIIWRNAPNISYDDIIGYDIQLVNSATKEERILHLEASATFYILEDETFKHESTFLQVNH